MNAPTRHRLLNRRDGIRENVAYGGRTYPMLANFDPERGTVAEVFIAGNKSGSDMDALMIDGSILLSILMQAGYPAAHLAQRLSRHDNGEPASVIGAIADFAARVDAERAGEGA